MCLSIWGLVWVWTREKVRRTILNHWEEPPRSKSHAQTPSSIRDRDWKYHLCPSPPPPGLSLTSFLSGRLNKVGHGPKVYFSNFVRDKIVTFPSWTVCYCCCCRLEPSQTLFAGHYREVNSTGNSSALITAAPPPPGCACTHNKARRTFSPGERDVCLNGPLAPSHMRPKCMGRGELRGLSQRVQL
jgi:hypothetical protein